VAAAAAFLGSRLFQSAPALAATISLTVNGLPIPGPGRVTARATPSSSRQEPLSSTALAARPSTGGARRTQPIQDHGDHVGQPGDSSQHGKVIFSGKAQV